MADENAGYQKSASGKPLALEARGKEPDGRRFSPSIGRNKVVVRSVFLQHMPTTGTALEIASGTGEHGAHIAAEQPGLTWVYSDIDEASLASQAAWKAFAGERAKLEGPLTLDVTTADWTTTGAPHAVDGVFCANMIHIAPFAAAKGLFSGAGRYLRSGGRLMLYGPFARAGVIAPSNASFSSDLKRRNPDWGVRDLEHELLPLAHAAGLSLFTVIEMPANNLSVIFERA